MGVTQEGNLTTPAYLPTNTPLSRLIDGCVSPGVTHRAVRLLFCDAEIAGNRRGRRDAFWRLHRSVSGWLGYMAGGEMIASMDAWASKQCAPVFRPPISPGIKRWRNTILPIRLDRDRHGHDGRGQSVIESIYGHPRYWRDNEPRYRCSILMPVP